MTTDKKPPVHQAIRTARAEMSRLEVFVTICLHALEQSSKAVELVELSQRIAEELEDAERMRTEEELEEAKERAAEVEAFARQQKKAGFPYLFGLAVVRLWSILEAVVDGLIVDLLGRPDECKDREIIYSLKGPLLEFAKASPERQTEYLAEMLKDAVQARLKPGAGRFEAVLDVVGLGGGVSADLRRGLFELNQVRNVVVHKAGLADQRFAEACPWRGTLTGTPVSITALDFHLYSLSAHYYLLELHARMASKFGYRVPQTTLKLQEAAEDVLRKLWSDRDLAESEEN